VEPELPADPEGSLALEPVWKEALEAVAEAEGVPEPDEAEESNALPFPAFVIAHMSSLPAHTAQPAFAILACVSLYGSTVAATSHPLIHALTQVS